MVMSILATMKKNSYFFSHTHTHIQKHFITLPLKDSKTICLHYHKRYNSNSSNISLSKNRFYKHYQINKASTFSYFCTALFWFTCSVLFFVHHFNKFYHLLWVLLQTFFSRSYQGVLMSGNVELSWKFFYHNKYQIMIMELLKGQFLQKKFRKE